MAKKRAIKAFVNHARQTCVLNVDGILKGLELNLCTSFVIQSTRRQVALGRLLGSRDEAVEAQIHVEQFKISLSY